MKPNKKNTPFWKLIAAIALCQGVGIASASLSNTKASVWFAMLKKPTWNPPAYLFGPVWTTLYLLMGISLWLIWTNAAPQNSKQPAYYLFAAQLFLNFWWSIIFFRFEAPAWALVNITAMVVLIFLTILQFARFSKTAAWLLVPYMAWVSFATVLNFAIWNLNR